MWHPPSSLTMAGPKPQKRWLSIPIRIAARITVILAIWKKKQHQTYGNPGPDLGRPYTFQWEKTSISMHNFLVTVEHAGGLNDSIQFNVYLPASVHSGVWLGWILDCTYRSRSNCDCSWAFLSSSLSACIKSYNNQRKQQRCIPTEGANRKKQIQKYHEPKCVYLVSDTIHLSTKTLHNPSRPTWMVETIANDLLPLQNNASLCWVEPQVSKNLQVAVLETC